MTREDCAQAAAAAIAAETNETRVYEISGPDVVTYAEVARIASLVTGKPVEYVAVEPDALRAGMISAGLPPFVADLMTSFDVAVAKGQLAPATSAVKDLTGREPQRLADFLANARNVLV